MGTYNMPPTCLSWGSYKKLLFIHPHYSYPLFPTLQGLTASARMDPAERERCDMMGWLNQCIDTLNIQVGDQLDIKF